MKIRKLKDRAFET